MRQSNRTQKWNNFCQRVARLFCIGLLLTLLSSCRTPSSPVGASPTQSRGVTPTKIPGATLTAKAQRGTQSGSFPAGWDTAESANWAGYTLPRGEVTGVRAAWTEPAISNVPNAHVATWIGVGGWGASYNNIVQIGTLAYVTTDGQIEHTVWYETLPPNSWTFIGYVAAGDKVFASIELEHGSAQLWNLALVDQTTNQTFKVTVSFSSQRIYSDFIVEDPDATSNNGPPYYPFPRFPAVTFNNANVRYAQDWVAITTVRALQVTLIQSGVVVAIPGPLANNAFNVTRVGT
ncbi:MAG TPA: hypothetical protein DDW25_07525 [Ktedonobacter sp.]|nr:hypothetical protein [Ktedonobacter sp.]